MLLLIASFFALSGLYVLLEAPFVAVVQIIVYAGAIMVLFLFVVMLLNVPREDAAEWDRSHPLYRPGALRLGARPDGAAARGAGVGAVAREHGAGRGAQGHQPGSISSVADMGRSLFTVYMFPFEVTSILILAAMVGAVILAKREQE